MGKKLLPAMVVTTVLVSYIVAMATASPRNIVLSDNISMFTKWQQGLRQGSVTHAGGGGGGGGHGHPSAGPGPSSSSSQYGGSLASSPSQKLTKASDLLSSFSFLWPRTIRRPPGAKTAVPPRVPMGQEWPSVAASGYIPPPEKRTPYPQRSKPSPPSSGRTKPEENSKSELGRPNKPSSTSQLGQSKSDLGHGKPEQRQEKPKTPLSLPKTTKGKAKPKISRRKPTSKPKNVRRVKKGGKKAAAATRRRSGVGAAPQSTTKTKKIKYTARPRVTKNKNEKKDTIVFH